MEKELKDQLDRIEMKLDTLLRQPQPFNATFTSGGSVPLHNGFCNCTATNSTIYSPLGLAHCGNCGGVIVTQATFTTVPQITPQP